MRKLLTALIAVGMLMSGLISASAQDASTAITSGLNSPVTWTDERGNEVATLEVTNVENDWQEYGEYSTPERGYVFVAVTFNITNISGSSMIVEAYDFSLLDALGRNNGRAYVSMDENSSIEIFEEDKALATDESAELIQVFQVPADVAPAAFIWQPDSGMLVMVDISEGAVENSAIATGFNSPATWTDDRGNVVATLEVTGVNPSWQDFDEFYAPERGMVYVAIDFKVTNVSSTNLILEPYSFSLIDNTGLNNGRAWADAAEGKEPVFSEDTPLAAGESYEGTIVFTLLAEMQPSVLVWQPDGGLLHFVNISDGGEGTPAASPEASPAGDVPAVDAATPAADTTTDDAASASGTVTDVNGEPVVFNDAVDAENGNVRVVSTLDGWDGYDEAANSPVDGTRFFLVTVEVTPTNGQDLPVSPLDFTVNTESGGAYDGDLYLNAADAEVKITQSGSQIPAGEATTLVIPFMVPEGEVPVSVTWDTGADVVELSLVP